MFKKNLFFFLLFLLLTLFLIPSPVGAQSITPKRNELMPPGILRSLEAVYTRINRASDSIQRFQLRINTRLSKMKDTGVDTSNLEVLAENIQTQIKKLNTDLQSATELKDTLESSTNRKTALLAFRKQVILVRGDLQNIIKQQKNLVLEMKKKVI